MKVEASIITKAMKKREEKKKFLIHLQTYVETSAMGVGRRSHGNKGEKETTEGPDVLWVLI